MNTYKREEDYTDFYEEGEVQDLDTFLRQNGYDVSAFGNDAKKEQFVKEELCFASCESSILNPHPFQVLAAERTRGFALS